MSERHLHIISFDIPYPPNYGGVIDVFYKLKTLSELGIKIHLHCIEYPGRDRSDELDKYCAEVRYYPRKTGLWSALTVKPYIVRSRRSADLLENLLKDDYPILFEGLHSCYYIDHPRLKGRIKIYRESNIEHRYYFNLFKVDRHPTNKFYYLIASAKLRLYQKVLKNADFMFAVSQRDTEYLKSRFGNIRVEHLPSFHANNSLDVTDGKGDYALYHGNIEVPENEFAAAFLINEVFNEAHHKLIIAGMNPPESIHRLVSGKENIDLVANPDDEKMFDLIRNAHVNILVTFQATGLKLKLLNTLYNGRFCLVNQEMVHGTALQDICVIANSAPELKRKLDELFSRSFELSVLKEREAVLKEHYDNVTNGKRLIQMIYGS